MTHPCLYHPLVQGVLVYQIQEALAFLANLVVLDDLSHLACLAVLAGHFDLAFLDQVDLVGQAVLFHQMVQLVLTLQDVLSLLEVLVVLVPHSSQAFQNQLALEGQAVLETLEALCDQVVQVVPFLYCLWVQVVPVVLANLCDLALL